MGGSSVFCRISLLLVLVVFVLPEDGPAKQPEYYQ